MHVDLTDTTSSAVLTALMTARHRSGIAALGMVLTFVIDVDELGHYDALRAAVAAAREHPCRIVAVIKRTAGSQPRLDAEIRVGEEESLAEVMVLRLYGELRKQADSVVLPLLLPDAPVLVWWPGSCPPAPSRDPLGRLAQRRVTDAAASSRPLAALRARSADYSPGDTDLAWTRLTRWRTLLAAALDEPYDPLVRAEVGGARNNPSCELLAAWLQMSLGVPVAQQVTRGPGLTTARLVTTHGEIALTRPDGRLATLVRTGQPNRTVALPRRETPDLLAEELRRLDPDEVYCETLRHAFAGSADTDTDEDGPTGIARPATAGRAAGKAAAKQTTRSGAPIRPSTADSPPH